MPRPSQALLGLGFRHVTTEWGKSWLVRSLRGRQLALGLASAPYARARVRAGGFFPRHALDCAAGLLCLLLVARLTLADRPFAGWSAPLACSRRRAGAVRGWTLLSAGWSDAPARALTEFDRALLYLLVLAFWACTRVRRGRPRADPALGRRWRSAVTCAVALATRAAADDLPDRARASTPSGSRSRSPTGTRWACFCGLGRDPAHAPDGVRARAGGRPRRGGGARCRSSR